MERPIAAIEEGHTHQTVTRRYAHLAKGSLRPAIEDIARIEREGLQFTEIGKDAHEGVFSIHG